MDLKKICRYILFPNILIMTALVPLSAVLLIYSALRAGSESVFAIISYVISAYTLTVWCARIPKIINYFKAFKNENRYFIRWQSDVGLRIKVSLYGTLIFNIAYSILHIGLGAYHKTFWFYSLAAYYISLALMRFFLVRHTRRYRAGENVFIELKKYRACGWVFLLMNLALSLMIFFMVYWNRTFVHHEITTITMAAYTFTAFTLAIISVIKYRKYESPVYSASKAIGLASAAVSMLTLEATMLTTFGEGESALFRRIMLTATGAAVSAFILVMAIYMIIRANKGIRSIKEVNTDGK